jgi:DNA-binding CsgD family transcriptional regulator
LPAELDAMGVGEPGAFPLVWGVIDALVATGRPDEAEPIVARLEERAAALGRSWVRGVAARARALVAAARGDLPGALASTDAATDAFDPSRYPFENASALLLAGELHRRTKRKAAARASLSEALEAFDRLGARLWADRSRAELERVGGTSTGPEGLTPTERRVAELVAKGRTNREVADALFISVKTVEANLSRIYHKLGVRSRAELIATLIGEPARHA